jgi:hypothetical protein
VGTFVEACRSAFGVSKIARLVKGDWSGQLIWRLLPPVVFALVSAQFLIGAVLDPRSIGSHASIYTAAARAWLEGGDPWSVGPPAAVFAGPPTMLVPFVPFVALPLDLTRLVWTLGSAILAVVVIRRLRLPGWWLGFPPIAEAIYLGHPEILLFGLIVFGGPLAGLAALVKPYCGAPLIAERRWRAIGLGAAVAVLSIVVLPWGVFVERLPVIGANLARQAAGDSTFGQPILMLIAAVALGSLGPRRALWLAGPVLWPAAQPIYKVVCVPAISPLLAVFWAVPMTGMTLVGLVVFAVADGVIRIGRGPEWLSAGVSTPGLTAVSQPWVRARAADPRQRTTSPRGAAT